MYKYTEDPKYLKNDIYKLLVHEAGHYKSMQAQEIDLEVTNSSHQLKNDSVRVGFAISSKDQGMMMTNTPANKAYEGLNECFQELIAIIVRNKIGNSRNKFEQAYQRNQNPVRGEHGERESVYYDHTIKQVYNFIKKRCLDQKDESSKTRAKNFFKDTMLRLEKAYFEGSNF